MTAFFSAHCFIGHLFTRTGRTVWLKVIEKYIIFGSVCLGIWSDRSSRFFEHDAEVIGDHERFDLRDRHTSMLYNLVVPRALLLQIFPGLVLLSTYAIATCGSPLFVYSRQLLHNLNPILASNSYRQAQVKHMQCYHMTAHEQSLAWTLGLSSVVIYWDQSRALQYIKGAVSFSLSIALLLTSKPFGWLVFAVIALSPFKLSKCCMGLVSLGKLLRVTDDDFSVVGISFKDLSSAVSTRKEEVDNPLRRLQ